MSKQDFDAFINQATKKQEDASVIDWNAIRDEWLKSLSEFYELIKSFLVEYKNAEKLSYTFSKKEIFEEYIGSYSVDVMDIKLGEHRVKLEPIGTNLIGAHGRVDLIGANGKVRFGLVNENHSAPSYTKTTIRGENEPKQQDTPIKNPEEIKLAWKIATPPPRIKYKDLEQDVFLEALLEVIGG
jgi:hypothetical protein